MSILKRTIKALAIEEILMDVVLLGYETGKNNFNKLFDIQSELMKGTNLTSKNVGDSYLNRVLK